MSSNKTYTIELTELEAKVLYTLGGHSASGDNTFGKVLSRFYHEWDEVSSFRDFINGVTDSETIYKTGNLPLPSLPKSANVALNSSHTALVTPEGIKIVANAPGSACASLGCQTFPLSVVDELVKAVKEVRGEPEASVKATNRYGFRSVSREEATDLVKQGIYVEFTSFSSDSVDLPRCDNEGTGGWIPECGALANGVPGYWRTNDKARR